MASGSINEKAGYLTGKLLIAMPGMGDQRFNRAVIFICAHDQKGAMGLVINHSMPGLDLRQLLDKLHIQGAETTASWIGRPVMNGGPVESARGFILHSQDYNQKDTIRIDDIYGVTGTIDALRAVAEGRGPERMLFVLGYAGWSAGQLEREMQENAWLVADADPDIIFNPDIEHKWAAAIRAIGIDPAMLSNSAGHA